MLFALGATAAFSSFKQNKLDKIESKRQAGLSIFNAQLQEEQAVQIGRETRRQEKESRRLGRRVMGQQRAQVAGSGFTFAGQPTDLIAETAGRVELDALIIRENGQRAADQARFQGSLDRLEAQDIKGSSKLRRKQRNFETGMSLLSMFGSSQRARNA